MTFGLLPLRLGLTFRADTVQQHGVGIKRIPVLISHFVLALFDLGVGKLFDRATNGADQVIMMIAIVQFEYRLATVKLAAHQYARLLKLRKHPVYRRKADIDLFGNKGAIYVFGTLMPLISPTKNVKNLEAGKGRLQAHILQFSLIAHG